MNSITDPVATYAVRLLDASWSYGTARFTRNTLMLATGELAFVVGPNASGKSSLLQVVSRKIELTSGRLDAPDAFLGHVNPTWDLCGDIGVVQGSVKTEAVLRNFDLDALRPVSTLSRGQRSRLLLAACALAEEDLILLDQPASSLDSAGIDLCLNLIRSLVDAGKTVLVVTHNPEVLVAFEDAATYRMEPAGLALARSPSRPWDL